MSADSIPASLFLIVRRYYSAANAQSAGLINASANAPTYIGVDYTNVVPTYPNNEYGAGRASVRISTQRAWTHGLFIGDFAHAPGGICGTWPACGCHCDPTRYRADGVGWTLAPNWPNNGEIDILEGANSATQNLMSLHTYDLGQSCKQRLMLTIGHRSALSQEIQRQKPANCRGQIVPIM